MTRAAVLAACLVLCGCTRPQGTSPADSPPQVNATFRGLWFSEAEVLRIGAGERNVQPTRDINLETWDYTDPVGSTHPDVVNVVSRIANPEGAPARSVRVALREQWKIGGDSGETSAHWEEPLGERLSEPQRLASGQEIITSHPIAVGEYVKRRGDGDRYPWRLRVHIDVRDADSGKSLTMTQAELPIIPGD